ncbi:MAG: 50S ribosomal protein L18 [Candidatus Rokuibacteriota bacterium]
MTALISRAAARHKRHERLRLKVSGDAARPRLAVFRSLNHIYAQIIDDATGKTIVAADTRSPELRDRLQRGGNAAAAKLVGELLAQRASARGVSTIVFDRGGYQYHGRVKALAEAARAGGLKF